MSDETACPRRPRRLVALATGVVLAGGGATALLLTRPGPSNTFCTLQGYIDPDVLGRPTVMQDQSTPGRGCDGPAVTPGKLTIGLDCKIREDDGTVLGSYEPNRADGLCGHDGVPLGVLTPS